MKDIFVSYAREDRDRVMPLVRALEATGWSVFWDTTIPAGETFRKVIEAEIQTCRCMVVIWSETSINKSWVREEADEGKRRGVLIPVLIADDVRPPLGFREVHFAKLGGWDGNAAAAEFNRLIKDISRMIGTPPIEEQKQQADLEAARRAGREANRQEAQARKRAREKAEQEAEARRKAREAQRKAQAQKVLEQETPDQIPLDKTHLAEKPQLAVEQPSGQAPRKLGPVRRIFSGVGGSFLLLLGLAAIVSGSDKDWSWGGFFAVLGFMVIPGCFWLWEAFRGKAIW